MKKEKLKILLIGYGKMGKAIETIALQRGHNITAIISDKHTDLVPICRSYQPNIAFEFTSPQSAYHNISHLLDAGIPTVCGSTGWTDKLPEIRKRVEKENLSFFYAPNYSIGMNFFFQLAEQAGRFLEQHPEYEIHIEETHHTEKKDIPSGTAISIAERLIKLVSRKTNWKLGPAKPNKDAIIIDANRTSNIPGTHSLSFSSAIDTIELCHTAHSRMGFAHGAVLAGEWLLGKKGFFGMEDLLQNK